MNSPIGWPGGKKNLVTRLIDRIPTHRLYVEVFCGSAKLLFAKPKSEYEVINDLNSDLVNFFKVVKYRPSSLAEIVTRSLVSRLMFKEMRYATLREMDDELYRAYRFLYLLWFSYGTKGQHFASWKPWNGRVVRKNLTLVRQALVETADRLHNTLIEQLDFERVIERYDSPLTFFYCDPPYYNFRDNALYRPMPPERYERLFELIGAAKGKFLVSLDRCPEVIELCRTHQMFTESVRTVYSLGHSAKQVTELLIGNYRFSPTAKPAVAL